MSHSNGNDPFDANRDPISGEPRDQLLVEADRSMYRSKFGHDAAA